MADNKASNTVRESLNKETNVTPSAPKSKERIADKNVRAKASEVLIQDQQEKPEGGVALEAEGNVSEIASENAVEDKKGMGGGKKGDDDSSQAQQQTSGQVTFDGKQFPPTDKIIVEIEAMLRAEIRDLQKQAKRYQGGVFKKADYEKLNDVVKQIREKRVLIARLFIMAIEALKKLYISLTKPKKELSKAK